MYKYVFIKIWSIGEVWRVRKICKKCLRYRSGFDNVMESENNDDILIFLRVIIIRSDISIFFLRSLK